MIMNGVKNKLETVKIGTRCIVARCGSEKSYFGEFGTVTKELKNHLVITTDSGSIIKVNDRFKPVGKFSEYFASLNIENREDMITTRVCVWNSKKQVFDYK